MLPSWPEIYQTDSERTLDFVSAAAFGDLTRQAYLRSGYSLVDVPKTSREARLAFILKALKR
jgi:predicted ATPase